MLLCLCLLYVGAVLVLNGLWLMGQIEDREIVVINVVTGSVALGLAIYWAFHPGADDGSVKAAALTLLFSTTYFWVAHNRIVPVDGRGLGWFSLFVAITVLPVGLQSYHSAATPIATWMAWNWFAWSFLWFCYFLLLTVRLPILRFTAALTLLNGVLTGWLPGLSLLQGWIHS